MQRIVGLALAFAVLASPAAAAPWTTDYQMGTFIASGGSDEKGWIILECGDPASGQGWAGRLNLVLTPAAGSLPKKTLARVDLVSLSTDAAGGLPIPVTRDGKRLTVADELAASTRKALLHMLRTGDVLTVRTATTPGRTIGTIPLSGSAAALDGFGACED
jgi:hypothetical protein